MSANQTRNSTQAYAGDSPITDDEQTMPIGMGDLNEDPGLDPLANAGERKKFNTGSLVLVGVVVIALGGMWLMRALSQVSGMTTGNSDIELTIEKFLKGLKSSHPASDSQHAPLLASTDASVLAVLSESYTERQVPLDNVQRDPFIIFDDRPVISGDTVNVLSRIQAEKRGMIVRAAGQLQLKSVIMSATPLANVSGKIVRKGDEIVAEPEDIVFRVAGITSDSVMIVAEDASLDLTVPITLTLSRDR